MFSVSFFSVPFISQSRIFFQHLLLWLHRIYYVILSCVIFLRVLFALFPLFFVFFAPAFNTLSYLKIYGNFSFFSYFVLGIPLSSRVPYARNLPHLAVLFFHLLSSCMDDQYPHVDGDFHVLIEVFLTSRPYPLVPPLSISGFQYYTELPGQHTSLFYSRRMFLIKHSSWSALFWSNIQL